MRALCLIWALLFSGGVFAAGASPGLGHWWASVGSGGAPGTLIEPDNITYAGFFIVPTTGGSTDNDRFVYTDGGMWATSAGGAPGTGALYLSNKADRVGAINIPAASCWHAGSGCQTATINTSLGGYLDADIVANSADLPPGDFGGVGSASGTVLTISSVRFGTVHSGWQVSGPGIPIGTTLSFGGTGTGGIGTYTLNKAATTASGNYGQDANGIVIGGIVPRSDGNLLVNYYWYYPGGPCCSKNSIILSSDLTTVVNYDQQLGSGYDPSQFVGMAGTVGAEWQAALGGAYISGQGTLVANDARGTAGPSSYVFNPSFTASSSPVSLAALAHYPFTPSSENIVQNWDRATTGTWTFISGMDRGATTVVPTGFASVMVVGAHGTGPYCYGDPTSDPTLQRVPNAGGLTQCYDLGTRLSGSSDKGVHAWPYEPWVWLWSVSSVESVLAGADPWSIYPYAAFQLPWPGDTGTAPGDIFAVSGGAYYDQSSGYLYMICSGKSPMEICVWRVQSSTTAPFTITTTQDLPGCTHGTSCSTTLTSSGGAAPVTWKLLYTNPSYLSALSLSTSGVLTLSSADTQTGTYDVIVEATDANGQDNTIGLSLTISQLVAPHLNIAANDDTYRVAA